MPTQDAFYTLPDSLLSFILTKIPMKEAVKSSILSKRWRFIYTQMPELTFSPHLVLGSACTSLDQLLMSSVENIISNILLLHSGNLEAFHLHNTWLGNTQRQHFSHENLCKWVRYASWCNVKHLTLFDRNVPSIAKLDNDLKEIPPPALFSCLSLVTLYLSEYVLTSFPSNFVGFPHLITCELRDVQLTDESLDSLISLCPLLQKLEIIGYSGLGNVEIVSSTIERLSMERLKSLSINCPKLKFLSGYMIEDLNVNGVRFYELSYAIFDLEMHRGGTLRELNMDCSQGNSPGVISASRFLHIMGNFQSLKTLVIYIAEPFERESDTGVPLFDLLHRLPNLQVLSIFGFFMQELARDPIPECVTPPHLNLKKISVEILEFDHNEVAVISCLIQSTPSLEALKIQLPDEYNEGQCLKLFRDIMYLRRASSLARIIIRDGACQVIG